MNKRRQRTQALMQATARRRMAEQADNAIEQARFNRMVRQGVIVRDGQVDKEFWAAHRALGQTITALNLAIKGRSMLNSEGAGVGEGGSKRCSSTCQSVKY